MNERLLLKVGVKLDDAPGNASARRKVVGIGLFS